MRVKLLRWLAWGAGGLMLLAVFCLPATSLPLLSRLMGGTAVAPPAVVLIGLALLLWLPVWWINKEPLPREVVPLFAFLAAALLSTLTSFFIVIPSYKGLSPLSEGISALLTLVIGISTYLAFSLWGGERRRLTWILRVINLGGALTLFWSCAQLFFMILRNGQFPGWMVAIQDLLSINSLYTFSWMHRAHGFAFEPSWLANQLNLLYLPYWLGATLAGYTAFPRRIARISAENIFLVVGLGVMLGSMSRIGLLTLLLLAAYLVLNFTRYLARKWSRQFSRPRLATTLIASGLFLLYGILGLGLVYAMSKVDVRLALIFDMTKIPSDWFALVMDLAFAERVVYWAMGFTTFGLHPLLGVGLGNAGFFFHQSLPARAPVLVEVIKITMQSGFLPNVKSLWMRLLGETGLVGFGLFTAWMVVLWGTGKFLRALKDPLLRAVGWMGLLALLAQVGDGFSIDTFALPYSWVTFGILTAVGSMMRRENKNTDGVLHDKK